MKLNNKGFAISVILYSMIILIIGVLYLLLGILNTRHNLLKKTNDEVVDYINNQGINTITGDRAEKIGTNRIINTGELLYVSNNNNYYFYGNDPHNYIEFNNETWRIIGVFSINNIKHLKLIRRDYLKIDTTNDIKIADGNIFTYLNEDYYKTITDKNMIDPMYWRNSSYSPNMTPLNAYNEEIKVISAKKNHIGLISGSDFGYAAGSTYLTNKLSSFSSSINQNWLALTNNYFTMNYYDNKLNIISDGNLINTSNKTAYIYPVVYLKKDVFIVGGTGLINDPYILSFN